MGGFAPCPPCPQPRRKTRCALCAPLIAVRDATASSAAMVMATAHALGMTGECAMQRARPAGFVAAVLIRALPGPRYRASIPSRMPCHSTSTHGAPVANTTNLTLGGMQLRAPASFLGTITAVYPSLARLDSIVAVDTRPLDPAARPVVASTTLSVLRAIMQ